MLTAFIIEMCIFFCFFNHLNISLLLMACELKWLLLVCLTLETEKNLRNELLLQLRALRIYWKGQNSNFHSGSSQLSADSLSALIYFWQPRSLQSFSSWWCIKQNSVVSFFSCMYQVKNRNQHAGLKSVEKWEIPFNKKPV